MRFLAWLLGKFGISVSIPLGSFYDELAWKVKTRKAVLDFALKHCGDKYVFGVEVEDGREDEAHEWDCSELVEHAFKAAGNLPMPDGSGAQYGYCREIVRGIPMDGDLGFLRDPQTGKIDHVELRLDDTRTVGAVGGSVSRVRIHPFGVYWFEHHPGFAGWRRHPSL